MFLVILCGNDVENDGLMASRGEKFLAGEANPSAPLRNRVIKGESRRERLLKGGGE